MLGATKHKGGKRRKTPECYEEIDTLNQSLEDAGFVRNSLDNDHYYSLSLVFYLKDGFGRRDVDNMLKVVVDVLSRYFGFNDNRVISYKHCKRQIVNFEDEYPREYLYFTIEQVARQKSELEIDYKDFQEWVQSEKC